MALDWDDFERQLTTDFINLPARYTVALGDHPRMVFFSQEVDRVFVETASNEGLPEGFQLTAEQEQWLADAGWQPDSPEQSWWHQLDFPYSTAAAAYAAGLICRTLRFYGQDIATLGYYAWSNRTGEPVELPSLRELRRHPGRYTGS